MQVGVSTWYPDNRAGAGAFAEFTPLTTRNGPMRAAYTGQQSIRRRYVNNPFEVGNLVVALPNWRCSISGEIAGANDITVRMSVECPIGATPVHFKDITGSDTITIAPGDTTYAYETSGLLIPASTPFYIHTYVVPTPGGAVPAGRFAINNGGNPDKYVRGASVTDRTGTIGGETTTAGSPADLYSAILLLGKRTNGTVGKCVVVFTDSIGYGLNEDGQLSADNKGAVGPYERWASLGEVPAINLGVPSQRASQAALWDTGAFPRTLSLIRDFTGYALIGLGRNDIGASATKAAVKASIERLARYTKYSLGCYNIGVTVSPQSTSTDMFKAASDQTTAATNPVLVNYNTDMRDPGLRPAYIDYVLDVQAYVEDTPRNGKFITNGVANTYTNDGLHFRQALNILVAAALPPANTIVV